MRVLNHFTWLLAAAAGAAAQVVTTIAGTDVLFPRPSVPAPQAPMGAPSGLAFDARGNLLICDIENNLVLRLAAGQVEVVAGTTIPAFSTNIGEGIPAARATLAGLRDLTVDAAGNIYLLTPDAIRKIGTDGLIRTVSGDTGRATFSTAARIAADNAGNVYVSDTFQHRVRKVTAAGAVSNFAGTGTAGDSGDNGPAVSATMTSPSGLAALPDGTVLIATAGNRRVRRVAPNGVISTVPGTAANVDLADLITVAVEPGGGILYGGRWLRALRNGAVTNIINDNPPGFAGDGGPASAAQVSLITGIAANTAGEIYLSDSAARTVRRIGRDGVISTVVGTGTHRFGGDRGPAVAAVFSAPGKLALDANGGIYLSDTGNRRYRRILPSGDVDSVVGLRTGNIAPDPRPAAAAVFSEVAGVAVDSRGFVYFADPRTNAVRRMGPDGRVTLFAGDPGAASLTAPGVLVDPVALAVAPDGRVYIGERRGGRVLRVNADGTGMTAVAGRGVASATFAAEVSDLAFDRDGVLYISTTGAPDNSPPTAIRAFSNGTLRAAIDTTRFPLTPGAPALAVDANNMLYFTDNCAIFRLGPGGVPVRVAGTVNTCGSDGDGGLAVNAVLGEPAGLAFDRTGALLFTERLTHRVRRILTQPPAIAIDTAELRFAGASRGAPAAAQVVTLTGDVPNQLFTVAVDDASKRWLFVEDPLGVTPRQFEIWADPEELPAGVHEGTVTFTAANSNPRTLTVRVRFDVSEARAPTLELDRASLTFAFPRSASARAEAVVVANAGSGSMPFRAAAVTATAGPWLQVSPAQGIATPRASVQLTVTADPSGLAAGTYTGSLTVQSTGGQRTIPVTLMVSARDHAIQLSQSGLSFVTVETGGSPPAQEFAVINTGVGEMAFSVAASTLAGGSWLRVSPPAGTSTAGAAPPVIEVSVNAQGLAPGRYYGQVRVDSPTAANSPHAVTVNLEVLGRDENPGAALQPAELTFERTEGGAAGAREFFIYNLTPKPVGYRSRAIDVAILPRDATVEPGKPVRVLVQPLVAPETLRRGAIFLQFSDGILRKLPVTLRGSDAAVRAAKGGAREAGACAAKELIPAVTSLGQGQSTPAGWPVGVSVEVKDDCGEPVDAGSVTLSFSNGDPPIALQPLKDGRWQGTWQSRAGASARVVVRVEAEQPAPRLKGVREVTADLRASTEPPAVPADGVVNTPAPEAFAPLAPGGLISVRGERLTETALDTASTTPLPVQLAGSEVVVAGQRIPLTSAASGQIDAVLPAGLTPDTTHQVLVRRGSTYSRPVAVNVASAQPACFSTGGVARATVIRADGEGPLSTDRPARAGDKLVLFCSGLGAVEPAVNAGEAGPDPAAVVKAEVKVRFARTAARVESAVLAPGLTGVYLVTVSVPEGIEPADAVPTVVETAGQSSPPVNVAVR